MYAGRGYGGRAVHLMGGKRNVMTPGGEVAAQLIYFGSNPRTLCGMRVARDMSDIFAADECHAGSAPARWIGSCHCPAGRRGEPAADA